MVVEHPPSDTLIPGEITAMLADWNEGDRQVMAQILPVIYDQLRGAAEWHIQGESGQHTLQPTALINEVYIRLIENQHIQFSNRLHFFWFAGKLMRRILVDHARRKMSLKRGGDQVKQVFDDNLSGQLGIDPSLLIDLDDALKKLHKLDSRQSLVVELKFFCGLRVEEICDLLERSSTSVKRDWRTAKRWLARELKGLDMVESWT